MKISNAYNSYSVKIRQRIKIKPIRLIRSREKCLLMRQRTQIIRWSLRGMSRLMWFQKELRSAPEQTNPPGIMWM